VARNYWPTLSAGVEAIEQAFDRIIQDKLKSRKKQKAGLYIGTFASSKPCYIRMFAHVVFVHLLLLILLPLLLFLVLLLLLRLSSSSITAGRVGGARALCTETVQSLTKQRQG